MVAITNTTQLSVFSLVRAAITANATLSYRFNNANIYQYEPKHKSGSFKGFPYIWIDIPATDTTKTVLDYSVSEKEFTADMYLRLDYRARDNTLDYANAIIKSIEAYESTFQSSGYYDVKIELVSVDSNQVIDQKELVEAIFEITWHGHVTR